MELFWAFLSLKPELVSRKHQTKIWRGVPWRAIQEEILWICVSGSPPCGLQKWLYVLGCPELTHQGGLLQAFPEESTSARGHTNDTCSSNFVIKSLQNKKHMRGSSPHLPLLLEVLKPASWMGGTNPSPSLLLKLFVLGYSIAYI